MISPRYSVPNTRWNDDYVKHPAKCKLCGKVSLSLTKHLKREHSIVATTKEELMRYFDGMTGVP